MDEVAIAVVSIDEAKSLLGSLRNRSLPPAFLSNIFYPTLVLHKVADRFVAACIQTLETGHQQELP